MKFYFEKITLWLKNGKKREIIFHKNKVNVLTGESNTGKSAILQIIDYCLFSSTLNISEDKINENVMWYGITFNINNNTYTIARKSLEFRRPTNEYYFSSTGETPTTPTANIDESSLKLLLESDFNIDSNATIAYGGAKQIKLGSKISLRYFLMFNTISGDIIESDNGIFFDKQNEERYRDALPRIFDLAVGIETIENILKKEKKQELENEKTKLERKESKLEKKSTDFLNEKKDIIKKAKEYLLIGENEDENQSWEALKLIVRGITPEETKTNSSREKTEKEYYAKRRKRYNLERFSSEYGLYKNSLSKIEDSLKPISYLEKNDPELIKTSIFNELIELYKAETLNIKANIANKTPIDRQINDELKKLDAEIKSLSEQLSIFPEDIKSFENDKHKYMFIGEIKTKINLYSNDEKSPRNNYAENIKNLDADINSITIKDTSQTRELTIKAIEEIISEYIETTADALGNYKDYKPVFNYKDKSISLRKPKSSYIEKVGSSSNHMFLHLFFSLAMQEISNINKSPFVAPFLIIDQLSRPYYGNEPENRDKLVNNSDTYKIQMALNLLNGYIENRIDGDGFQILLLEHIPVDSFKHLQNFHLVEEFRNGNALIKS